MPVRVTYAHKRRRTRNAPRALLSSPLEVLKNDVDDISRTQMVRRMLKRSRRVALAEQLQDTNTAHVREHVAKRIKHSQDHVSRFKTPFSSPQLPTAQRPPEPEQLSPVPRAKRTMGRTTPRRLKENDPTSSRTLDSPFNSRPGSTTSSPRKHNGRARLSRRVLRYMRSQLDRASSDAHFRTPDNDAPPWGGVQPQTPFYTAHSFGSESPRGPVHGYESFYTAQPRSVSTPAILRVRQTGSPPGHTEAGSFITEYEIPLADASSSPSSSAATKMLRMPKLSVTDPDFSGTRPVHDAVSFHRCKRFASALIPPALPNGPPSPASDLAQEFGSIDIGDDPGTQSDGDMRRASAPMPLLTRAYSLHGGLTNTGTVPRTAVFRRRPARTRAGTIRASDFVRPSSSSSSGGGAPGTSTSALSDTVRRTRSGTVVGPDSRLAAVPSGSESEFESDDDDDDDDDELLLKSPWIEDMVYLGLSKPVRDVEGDELNLTGPFSCRPGLRRR